MTRPEHITSALVHLVFSECMSIDAAMEQIAWSHHARVASWATKGRAEFRAFESWVLREVDRAKLADQLENWWKAENIRG